MSLRVAMAVTEPIWTSKRLARVCATLPSQAIGPVNALFYSPRSLSSPVSERLVRRPDAENL